MVYLTLNDVLTLNKENDEYSDLAPPANTTVVSSTVHPRPPAVLNDPVKIVLQNRRVFKLFLSMFRNCGPFYKRIFGVKGNEITKCKSRFCLRERCSAEFLIVLVSYSPNSDQHLISPPRTLSKRVVMGIKKLIKGLLP